MQLPTFCSWFRSGYFLALVTLRANDRKRARITFVDGVVQVVDIQGVHCLRGWDQPVIEPATEANRSYGL